jgi:hypothetical protein
MVQASKCDSVISSVARNLFLGERRGFFLVFFVFDPLCGKSRQAIGACLGQTGRIVLAPSASPPRRGRMKEGVIAAVLLMNGLVTQSASRVAIEDLKYCHIVPVRMLGITYVQFVMKRSQSPFCPRIFSCRDLLAAWVAFFCSSSVVA